MIDPVTAMGGSAIGGAVLGLLSNLVTGFFSSQVELAKVGAQSQKDNNEQVNKYQAAIANSHPPYSIHLLLITATYCLAVAICFFCGDIPVATQGFGGEPTETSLALGLFKRTSPDTTVYLLTFAGLGTYFMSPLAFILTSVFTGIVPRRGR